MVVPLVARGWDMGAPVAAPLWLVSRPIGWQLAEALNNRDPADRRGGVRREDPVGVHQPCPTQHQVSALPNTSPES